MAEAIRIDTAAIIDAQDWSGLYVLEKYNSANTDIPLLPILTKNPKKQNEYFILQPFSSEAIGSIHTLEQLDHFSPGDIVYIDGHHGKIRGILNAKANANTLLVTEQCDNFCKFCSQPPKTKNDVELYEKAALSILNYGRNDLTGISGGEPTLNKNAFRTFLQTLNSFNNTTPLHILTNGRGFSEKKFCTDVTETLGERFCLWGIPIYGYESQIHNYLVDADNAFIETVSGIRNLLGSGQAIEIRIVPVRDNLKSLPLIIDFIQSNLNQVTYVSIMNMEPKGLARKNFNSLFVPQHDQNSALLEAIEIAETHSLKIRLFNYALCQIDAYLHKYACKSISDWKNYYTDECNACTKKTECGGMFTSADGRFLEKPRAFI